MGSAAEAKGKGSMEDFYDALDHARKPASVHVPDTKNLGKHSDVPAPGPNESKQEKKERLQEKKKAGKMDRAEMERVRTALKERVDKQGQKGYDKVESEVN
jgi:hypothetical protein